MNIRVFIQNEAGSDQKHYHDEKTLEWKRLVRVSRQYPFPYGFIVGTTADDDCNVDCFVLTGERLKTGQLVECQVAGLMEQFEDGQEDHNVLAVLPGSTLQAGKEIEDTLSEFVLRVFEHVPGKRINVGRFLDVSAAQSYIEARLDGTSDVRPPSCVGALIRNDEGRVFVQRRSSNRRVWPGIWDIVGGHLEAGETIREALAREIREETGWMLRHIGPQIADWEWEHGGVVRRELDYLVDVEGDLDAPQLENTKHDGYAWIGPDNLDLMMTARTDVESRLRDIVAGALACEEAWGSDNVNGREHR